MISNLGWLAFPAGLVISVLVSSLGFMLQTLGLKEGNTVIVCTSAAVSSMATGETSSLPQCSCRASAFSEMLVLTSDVEKRELNASRKAVHRVFGALLRLQSANLHSSVPIGSHPKQGAFSMGKRLLEKWSQCVYNTEQVWW